MRGVSWGQTTTKSDATGKDRINVLVGRYQYRYHGTFCRWEERGKIYSFCDRLFFPIILIQALFERAIGYFGCPQKILSDRETEFTGRVWSEMMELMGIRQMLTTPYYPQGNGIVERSHRTIGNMIQAQLAHRDGKDWVDVLPGIMLMFNEMDQENHGYSASRIMWGQRESCGRLCYSTY